MHTKALEQYKTKTKISHFVYPCVHNSVPHFPLCTWQKWLFIWLLSLLLVHGILLLSLLPLSKREIYLAYCRRSTSCRLFFGRFSIPAPTSAAPFWLMFFLSYGSAKWHPAPPLYRNRNDDSTNDFWLTAKRLHQQRQARAGHSAVIVVRPPPPPPPSCTTGKRIVMITKGPAFHQRAAKLALKRWCYGICCWAVQILLQHQRMIHTPPSIPRSNGRD